MIELVGDGASIRETIIRIKRLLDEYRVVAKKGGLREYAARRIHREAGLAIPMDVLAEVLKRNGWRSEAREDAIETTAPFQEVVSAARLVAEALEAMKHVQASRSAKKALATAMAATGAPLEDAVRAGLEAGVIVENDEGRLETVIPWREAAREIIRRLVRS